MWRNYETNKEIAKRIPGITKRESLEASKHDGGCGVVLHPATGKRIYWCCN